MISFIGILILVIIVLWSELRFHKKREKLNDNLYETKRQTQQLFNNLEKHNFTFNGKKK